MWLVSILLGISLLLPWNVHLKALPHFSESLAKPSLPSFVASIYTVSNTAAMIVLVFGLDCFGNPASRIKAALFANSLLLIATISVLLGGFPAAAGRTVLYGIVAVTGIVTALFQKGLYAFLVQINPKYTPPSLAGQAIAGCLVGLLNVLGSFFDIIGVSFYFCTAILVLLATLLCFRRISALDDTCSGVFHLKPAFQDVWPQAVGVFATLAGTLSLFASFVVSDKTGSVSFVGHLFVPVVLLVYDLADVAGRWLPAFLHIPLQHRWAHMLPWFRWVIFMPLFLMAPLTINQSSTTFPMVQSLVYYFAVVMLFGISNGYCCTLLLMHAPQIGKAENAQATGILMGLFINLGLAAGSIASFGLRGLCCKCNPFL